MAQHRRREVKPASQANPGTQVATPKETGWRPPEHPGHHRYGARGFGATGFGAGEFSGLGAFELEPKVEPRPGEPNLGLPDPDQKDQDD